MWTPRQQKWWYEVMQGDPFSGAKFCRAEERARKTAARRVHLGDLARKAAEKT